MNILHLLSQNHLTGAEVYAAELIEWQHNSKLHNVYQVSNGFFYPTSATQTQLAVETKSKWQFAKNVFWLREYLKTNEIHVVHSHSRAAAKMAFYATLGTHTAHVSTVHGVQHTSLSKKLFNQYGELMIAVCENLRQHLIADFSYEPRRIHVLPNPVSAEKYFYLPTTPKSTKRVAIIGRTTGPKGIRTLQALRALLKSDLQIDLVGGEIADFNLTAEEQKRVQLNLTKALNSTVYSQYDLVIGSGRVCMESLITGCPTIAFGEAVYEGLVSTENFSSALKTNFGDIHPTERNPHLPEQIFLADVARALQTSSSAPAQKKLSELAKKSFDLNLIGGELLRHYESAYFLKNYPHWIPTLMYHKIPDTELQSQHKIYVTKAQFEKHLQFYSRRGFKTLTFSELSLYRKGLVSFKSFPRKPLILTFDDGYRDNLTNASPLLKKYGFRAQLFLLADSGVDANHWDISSTEPAHEIVSGEERKLWKQSAFEIGSHGFTHRKLNELSPDEAQAELTDSKVQLEAEFKQNVPVFAFTYGITVNESRELAKRAGYEYAVHTDTGGLLVEEDPYAIFRVNMFPDESFWSLYKKTSRWYRRYYFRKRGK